MKSFITTQRQVLQILCGAWLLFGPMAYIAWRWSHGPLLIDGFAYVGGTKPGTAEWIRLLWPHRLVDPDSLEPTEHLETVWRDAETSARIQVVFWLWIGVAAVILVIIQAGIYTHTVCARTDHSWRGWGVRRVGFEVGSKACDLGWGEVEE